MFVTKKDLLDEFDIFNLSADNEFTDSFLKICEIDNLSSEEIVTKWMAFSYSNGNPNPHIKHLTQFQEYLADVRNKKSRKSGKVPNSNNESYNAQRMADMLTGEANQNSDLPDVENLMDSYSDGLKYNHTTPRGKKTIPHNSPLTPIQNSSPIYTNTPLSQFSTRSNSLQIISTCGSLVVADQSHIDLHFELLVGIPPNTKFMSNRFQSRSRVALEIYEEMMELVQEAHTVSFENFNAISEQLMSGFARISSNHKLGRFSVNSAVLSTPYGDMDIDLSQCSSYSLFPGQYAAVTGENRFGSAFTVKSVIPGVYPPRNADISIDSTGMLTCVFACGPFSASDSTTNEGFAEILQLISNSPPDVLILSGPFCDIHNETVKSCRCESYETFFIAMMTALASKLEKLPTQAFIIPSIRDAHHFSAYPISPFTSTVVSTKITYLSEPSIFSLNGLIFGCASTDILLHLSACEISRGQSSRLLRLASHLLLQRSFYPLHPPASEVCYDATLAAKYGRLDCLPHVLFVPSDLKPFMKTTNGCLVVNSGRVMKGNYGGSFARLTIDFAQLQSSNVEDASFIGEIVRI